MRHPVHPNPPPIQTLDVVRGFALLGLLLNRVQHYSLLAGLNPNPVAILPLEPTDAPTPAHFFVALLVHGPAEALFSGCFGWSFYRLWQRGQQAGLATERIVQRQLGALLGLGLWLGWVSSWGNLLLPVALLGFSLPYFSRQARPALLGWIAGLTIGVVLIHLMPTAPPEGLERPVALPSATRLLQYCRAYEPGLTPYLTIEILLLVGLLMGKRPELAHRAAHWVRLSWLILLVFPLAVGLKGVGSLWTMEVTLLPARWQGYEARLGSLCELLGTPLLALVYLLEIDLNVNHPSRTVGGWVGQAGRMSLTNYLLLNGLSGLVFDPAGPGLLGSMSLWGLGGVVLMVYGLGLYFSHWWLSRHPQGPLEGLLIRWSYGKAGSTMAAASSLL